MISELERRLEEGVLIFDGGVGSELYKKNFFVNTAFEAVVLTAPDAVKKIHQAYIDAGVDVLTTNTFNASQLKLAEFGLGEEWLDIVKKNVELAKAVAKEDTLIAGSIGPTHELLHIDKKEIVEDLVAMVNALANNGVDFIIFETLSSTEDLEHAIAATQEFPELPYVLSFSVDKHAETITTEEALVDLLDTHITTIEHQPVAFGLNCGNGVDETLHALTILREKVSRPIIVQPNAGELKTIGGRRIQMTTPEYLTTYAQRFTNLGVKGVGGCCGVSPEHIASLVRAIRPFTQSEKQQGLEILNSEELELKPRPPMSEKSMFGAKLSRGEWVKTVEITPPRGYDLSGVIEKAKTCKRAGVDAINIPDGPRASARISPIITSLKIQEEAEIEAILHFCCRDKNLIGMQSDLLGCAESGLNNILFITGGPPKLGDYPFATAVFDVDAIGTVKIQDYLNRGVDLGGKPLPNPTNCLMGVGADPNAVDYERELRRLHEKIDAGAEYIITQPIFSVESLLRFLDDMGAIDTPVIAGMWPLANYRNALFMKNEVPGVVVPDTIMERMAKYTSKEDQRKEGILIARENLEKIKQRVQGVQVSAPFGNVNTAIAVLSE